MQIMEYYGPSTWIPPEWGVRPARTDEARRLLGSEVLHDDAERVAEDLKAQVLALWNEGASDPCLVVLVRAKRPVPEGYARWKGQTQDVVIVLHAWMSEGKPQATKPERARILVLQKEVWDCRPFEPPAQAAADEHDTTRVVGAEVKEGRGGRRPL